MKFVPTIRPAIERDAPFLVDIDVKCYDYAWLDEDWGIVWDDKDTSVHVATVYGTPVGFAVTERIEQKDRPTNHIYKIAVKEQFRGNNVGRMLLAVVYDEAQKLGMKYLTLAAPATATIKGHPRYCLPWIEKMGFKAVQILHDDLSLWGHKEDIIIFQFEVK